MLLASPHRGALRHLNLSSNDNFTSQAITYVAASPLLEQLDYLSVSFIGMTKADVIRLAESEYMKRRGILHLPATSLSKGDKIALQNRYGSSFGHFSF